MSLVKDAIPNVLKKNNFTRSFFEEKMNKNILEKMICDLDETEVISIIFLMTDKNTDISKVIKLIKDIRIKEILFIKFMELNNSNSWEEKLVEILIIVGNFNIIRKLGFNETQIKAMKEQFVCDIHNVTPNLNRIIKSLYFLCENLNISEVSKLVTEVNKSMGICLKPLKIENNICLELYILHWLMEKYITIDEKNPNLNNLLKSLKDIGICNLTFNFNYWDSTKINQLDSLQIIEENCLLQYTSSTNQSNEFYENSNTFWSVEHMRLCIIINEINFIDKIKYKTRLGSNLDEKNLKDTFKGCDFEIEAYQDLTKNEMMIFLDSLNEPPYNDYGSIFMCILSHGFEGEVIFSDGQTIDIKTIEEKFCCQNLQKVFKFVILQSCQGKQLGVIDRKLVTDNLEIVLTDSSLVTDGLTSPIYHMHFGLFQATISNFVAMRNESKGTWFIQDICDELKNSTPIKVKEWVQNVTKRLSNRRDKSKHYKKDIVQVPRFMCSMSSDYVLPQYHEEC